MRLIAKQNMKFEQWISLCSRYVFLDPIWKNVLFYVERKPVDKYPEPFPLSTKMDHIRRSQFYARNSHLHNLLNHLYNELSRPNRTPSGGAGSNDEQLMLFNAYFILATGSESTSGRPNCEDQVIWRIYPLQTMVRSDLFSNQERKVFGPDGYDQPPSR
ncbi:hypothetical protein FB446DRAFT_486319 [Lentinula raphanica]|nr:hypothetical protein FB446DRAFT_486319 [Lentinula raphanica]